jgi:4-hydroxy-2-oxoheptanedioate aldolase
VNWLKAKSRTGGDCRFGTWAKIPALETVEMLGHAGFDFVVIDMEHAPNELHMVHHQLHAVSAYPVSAVVRAPWNDTVVIKRLLDVGAQSLLLPYVQNEEEAKRAVAAVRYPPKGVRGVSTSSRANRFSA